MGFKTKNEMVDLCEYCWKDFFGDINEDILDIQHTFDGKRIGGTSISVRDDSLELFIYFAGGEDMAWKTKINYCPMCGRKLKEG